MLVPSSPRVTRAVMDLPLDPESRMSADIPRGMSNPLRYYTRQGQISERL